MGAAGVPVDGVYVSHPQDSNCSTWDDTVCAPPGMGGQACARPPRTRARTHRRRRSERTPHKRTWDRRQGRLRRGQRGLGIVEEQLVAGALLAEGLGARGAPPVMRHHTPSAEGARRAGLVELWRSHGCGLEWVAANDICSRSGSHGGYRRRNGPGAKWARSCSQTRR